MSDYSDIKYLIEQLTAGSEAAWSFFLKKYGGSILNGINKIMYSYAPEDKDNCFLHILLRLKEDEYRRLKLVRNYNEGAFRNFLKVLSKNFTLNYKRDFIDKGKREEIFYVDHNILEEIHDSIYEEPLSPDDEVFQRELQDIINQFLEILPEKERLLIHYFLEGLAWKEIAEIMEFEPEKIYPFKEKVFSKIRNFLSNRKKGINDVSNKIDENFLEF